MIDFIVRMIKNQTKISKKKGIEKYKAYFVKTKLYQNYRDAVDELLRTDGYEDIIVTD